jgi:hypothetical protein
LGERLCDYGNNYDFDYGDDDEVDAEIEEAIEHQA